MLASQKIEGTTETVHWEHRDVSDASFRTTDVSGLATAAAEMDAVAANAGLMNPFSWNAPDKIGLPVPYPEIADMLTSVGGGCVVDKVVTPCSIRKAISQSGAGSVDPDSATAAGTNLPGLIPIYENLCVTVIGGGRIQTVCEDYVTSYQSLPSGGLGSTLSPNAPQNPRTPVSEEEREFFKHGITLMLADEECWHFLGQVIGEVESRTGRGHSDILDTFDKTTFYWRNHNALVGYATFEHGQPVALIANNLKTEKFVSADRTAYLTNATIGLFFSETVHLAGSGMYSDADYSNAVNARRVRQGLEQPRTFSDRTDKDVWEASAYWHDAANKHCRPVGRKL